MTHSVHVQTCRVFPFVESPFIKSRHFVPPYVVRGAGVPKPPFLLPAVRVQFWDWPLSPPSKVHSSRVPGAPSALLDAVRQCSPSTVAQR